MDKRNEGKLRLPTVSRLLKVLGGFILSFQGKCPKCHQPYWWAERQYDPDDLSATGHCPACDHLLWTTAKPKPAPAIKPD